MTRLRLDWCWVGWRPFFYRWNPEYAFAHGWTLIVFGVALEYQTRSPSTEPTPKEK